MDDFHHPHADMLFHNEPISNFKLLPSSFLEANEAVSMGFAYADYDRDGWLDFVQGNWNEGFRLYHNEALAGGEMITVEFVAKRRRGGKP
ncbi:MAG: hypothetical protein R2865_11425 [Deinococcales bacterium]